MHEGNVSKTQSENQLHIILHECRSVARADYYLYLKIENFLKKYCRSAVFYHQPMFGRDFIAQVYQQSVNFDEDAVIATFYLVREHWPGVLA